MGQRGLSLEPDSSFGLVPDASADGFLSVEPGFITSPNKYTSPIRGVLDFIHKKCAFFFTGIAPDIGNFSYDVSSSDAFR